MSTTIKTITIMSAALSLAAAGFLLWAPASPVTSVSNSTQQCEKLLSSSETQHTAAQCQAPSNQVTWSNWAKGESRSAQFHFIDLFELLFSSSDSAKKSTERFNQQSSL